MARTQHNANWRALRRFVTVLLANVGTELTADGPAGLNVDAPAAGGYYVLPNERAVRELAANGNPRVYIFMASSQDRQDHTGGPSVRPANRTFRVGIAVHQLEEAGADDYSDTWKDLTVAEREFLRCETLMGAIMDVVDSKIVDGDDILRAHLLYSRSGADEFKRNSGDPGTWGRLEYDVAQKVTVPQQTS